MCRGASAIEFYDVKNRYIGEYFVGVPEDLPDKLKDNALVYLNNAGDCDLREKNSINLREGLPKSIFISCSSKGGNIYSFTSDD
jgi:hypothetical protein